MTELIIDKKAWIEMNQFMTREDIKEYIHTYIEVNQVPLPLRKVTESMAIQDFNELMMLDSTDIVKQGECFTRYDYKWWTPSLFYIDSSRVGNEASNCFHQQSRWLADSINSPSPYRCWTTRKFREGILNALWTLKMEEITTDSLRTAISLRKYVCSQFRPSAAKAIYEHFKARKILDFSSGWGDRFAGFYSLPETELYVGVDPNARLFEGYQKQYSMYKKLTGVTKSAIFIQECAEDLPPFEEKFDMVFTSPPYFNAERYTQEENQSWKRYRKLDKWLNGFLFKAVQTTWNALESGGYYIINISNVYTNHQINNICDPMNDYISGLAGAKWMGIIGYRMAKRPNSTSDKAGIFVEPIFVWKKELPT